MKQHTTPCKDCPFLRTAKPGELGGSSPETYIGQAQGSFWLPCHQHSSYKDPDWKTDYSKPQCAGAAIYRANCPPVKRHESVLSVAPDAAKVLASPSEFLSHHTGLPKFYSDALLKLVTPAMLYQFELQRSGVHFAREIPKPE